MVILTGSQNPTPLIGKPRHSSEGLTKPKANTSRVQVSSNPRFILGEPFLLLSSISTGTEGTQVCPWQYSLFLTVICARIQVHQKPRFALGTHASKTRGSPLVCILAKPKVLTLGTHFYKTQGTPLVRSYVATTITTVKGPNSTKWTCIPLFGKTFNRVEVIPTPHNHQRRNFVSQDDPSLDCMTRPSIKCSSHLLFITIRGAT